MSNSIEDGVCLLISLLHDKECIYEAFGKAVVSIVFWLLVSHVAYLTLCLCYCMLVLLKSNQVT